MKIKVDLTELIGEVLDQVIGSDERKILDDWLMRNGGKEVIVSFELPPGAEIKEGE